MNRILVLLLGTILLATRVSADERSFDGITCQSNIPSALVGRRMPNERVKAIEARYKHIGLKDLGAFGMENEGDPWTLISWEICGREYALLERHDIVKDVLESPLPPGSPQSQVASCAVNGAKLQGTAVVFIDVAGTKWPSPIKNAWLIDDKAVKFVRITGNDVVCTPSDS